VIEREADTVVILSSELISKITEEYFNKTMFKQKVEIVDLKPTETGYMFSVAFVQSVKREIPVDVMINHQSIPYMQLEATVPARASNGKFMKVSK
jgi:hypothetical protein